MMIFTHMKVGNYYIKQLKRQQQSIKIDRLAFVYGNVKPDISKMANVRHYFDETFQMFYDSISVAQNPKKSLREQSVALGVACHFLCDYFCKYHVKEPYIGENIIAHLYYEFKLHLAMKKHLKNILNPESLNEIKTRCENMFLNSPIEHVKRNLNNQIAFYERHHEAYETDLCFALDAIGQLLGELIYKENIEEDLYENRDLYGYVFTAS